MRTGKPILILQLRPEDVTSDSEYACFLKHGGLRTEDTRRVRIEKNGIPGDFNLDDYSAMRSSGSDSVDSHAPGCGPARGRYSPLVPGPAEAASGHF